MAFPQGRPLQPLHRLSRSRAASRLDLRLPRRSLFTGESSGPGSAGSAQGRSSSASQRGSAASETAASLGAGLKDTAQTAAEAVRQQAAQFAEDVGHELNKTSEAQKARGVEAIRQVARAIDSAAEELESQSPQIARTVHEAARRVDGLSDNLSNRNINDLIELGCPARPRSARALLRRIDRRRLRSRPLFEEQRSPAVERRLRCPSRQRPLSGRRFRTNSTGYDPYQR